MFWYQVLGTSTWYQVLGTKYLVPSIWYQVLGTKYLVPSTWYQVLGTKYLVPSTWYQVLGTKTFNNLMPVRVFRGKCQTNQFSIKPFHNIQKCVFASAPEHKLVIILLVLIT